MYSRYRFPSEVISYCIWLYYTFPLSYRNIEKMMLYRGIEMTYETIRKCCQKFRQQYANQLQRKRPHVADKWHLDEVVVTTEKEQYYLWRAVYSEGNVLDVLLQRRRDTNAAKRFFRKLLKKQDFGSRMIVTDTLKSYEAAKKQVMPNVEHRAHKGLNNRAENSHQLTRVRERRMRRSNTRDKRNAFSPILNRFETIFIRDNINWLPNAIVNNCANDLKIGEKWLGRIWMRKLSAPDNSGMIVLNSECVQLS